MMKLQYSKALYPKTALIKAAYSFTDRAYIHLSQDCDDYFVEITSKSEKGIISKDEFDNEMLAQTARYEIYKQTKNIRELITARAMASTVIEQKNQNEVIDDSEDNVDDILTDWFDKHDK